MNSFRDIVPKIPYELGQPYMTEHGRRITERMDAADQTIIDAQNRGVNDIESIVTITKMVINEYVEAAKEAQKISDEFNLVDLMMIENRLDRHINRREYAERMAKQTRN